MDIRRLEVFCKVVECKSFTRAADAVFLSQPSVSEHVRALEITLGVKLLDRLGREVLPTGAGEILYRHARRIIHLRDEAVQAIDHFCGTLAGHLPLGASTIPGAYLLPAVIETFRKTRPTIRTTLKIAGTARIVEDILQGELELGIVGARPRDPRLEANRMFADELVLVACPGHPWSKRSSVSLKELAEADFILREPGSGTRTVMSEALKEKGVDPASLNMVAEMGSTEAVRQGIKAGLGVSILSSLAVAEDVSRGTLVCIPIDSLHLERSFYLVQRKGRQPSPLALAFLDHLRQEAVEGMGKTECVEPASARLETPP